MTPLTRPEVAARLADDIQEGWHVNLGIGIPELVADYILPDKDVIFHSENGILGMGPQANEGEEDWSIINAGKKPVTAVAGASFFDHAASFALVRGRHLDLCVLGAYQVAANGDIANWARDANDPLPAIGGAMDLAVGAQRVFVIMTHIEKSGAPRILQTCTYPLTGAGVVKRIYSDLAVMEVREQGLYVLEMIGGISAQELQRKTGAKLIFDKTTKILKAKSN